MPCTEAWRNTKWNSAVCTPELGLFWAFHSLLLQDTSYSLISGVVALALCLVVVSQASQHFSLTVEVETVAHALHWIALRGDSQTTCAVILTDSVSLLQKAEWEAQTGMRRWLKTPVGVLPLPCQNEGQRPSR